MSPPFPPPAPDNEERAAIVFFEALRKSLDDRGRFLDEACGSDPGLRDEVEALLRDHESAGSFLSGDSPLHAELGMDLPRLKPEQPGEQIGPYKLLEQIGEGGFGTVWVAEQEKPVRRRVALKIIKPGMDTKAVIARFEQERQALAMMDHPNIARVLDAGTTSLGRPYFVMELVRGIKITHYCDQANLPTAERLRLFIAVCHAVQHAHQKGIIHRDLKPSNILVTLHDGVPVPKVIDFGVAKATQQQRLTELTIYTQFEQMIGTPLYMSPEQAEMSGLDIDTRSDIYSLGVLLYELLAGRTPFDPESLMKRGLDEIRRVVREQEPVKPSTFVSTMALDLRTTVARHRQTDSVKLIGQIRGDLDWIVMKALEKDRSRRYETANNFAEDIQRHLLCEPVQARPPTHGYRFRRFAKRNRAVFAAGTAVLVALLTGLAVSTWMFLKEKDARERAVAAEMEQARLRRLAEDQEKKATTEAIKSEQVATFLTDMLKGVKPMVARGRDTSILREILDETAGRVGKDLKDQPEVEAELRSNIGIIYNVLGEYEKAAAMHRQALALRRSVFGNEHIKVSNSLHNLGYAVDNQGKVAEATSMHREALAIRLKLLNSDHELVAFSLMSLAGALRDQGNYVESEAMAKDALERFRKVHSGDHLDVSSALNELGNTLAIQNKNSNAEAVYREALEMRKRLLGSNHLLVSEVLNNLGSVITRQGNDAEGEEILRKVLATDTKTLGNEHPGVARTLSNLSLAVRYQGRTAEAENLCLEALAMNRNLLGDVNSSVADSLNNLANLIQGQMRFDEVIVLRREELAIRKKLFPKGHPHLLQTLDRLAELLDSLHKWSEAEPLRRDLLDAARQVVPLNPKDLDQRLYALANNLYRQQKFAEADQIYRESLQVRLAGQPVETNEVASAMASLGRLLTDWAWSGRSSKAGGIKPEPAAATRAREAERILRDVLAIRLRQPGATIKQLADTRSRLGGAVLATAITDPALDPVSRKAKLTEAESLLVESFQALNEKAEDVDPIHMRDVLIRLVRLYETLGNRSKQTEWEQALSDLNSFDDLFRRAIQLKQQGKTAETEGIRRKLLALTRKSLLSGTELKETATFDLADTLRSQNNYAEAEPLYREVIESRKKRLPQGSREIIDGMASIARLLSDWAWSDRGSFAEIKNLNPKITQRAREAEQLLRDCLTARRQGPNATDWRTTGEIPSRLGGALVAEAATDPSLTNAVRLAKLTEAESLLKESNTVIQQCGKAETRYKRDSLTRLVRLYEAWEKPEKAAEWQKRLDEFDKQVEQSRSSQYSLPH